jgi:hypothetical protein
MWDPGVGNSGEKMGWQAYVSSKADRPAGT